MPISLIDGCSEQHWTEVKTILSDAIEDAGFEPNLVSDSDDVSILHRRIITNLYDNPIVVCDVSGKNPNVMFELGLRLAFDKPTIIVKDEKTSYSFDTSPIEHIGYPRDLRFNRIVQFKEQLTTKIIATHEKAESDPQFSTFLKHFGEFKVASIDTSGVSKEDFIYEELRSLRSIVMRMYERDRRREVNFPPSLGMSERNRRRMARDIVSKAVRRQLVDLGDSAPQDRDKLVELISELTAVDLDPEVLVACGGPDEFHDFVRAALPGDS